MLIILLILTATLANLESEDAFQREMGLEVACFMVLVFNGYSCYAGELRAMKADWDR